MGEGGWEGLWWRINQGGGELIQSSDTYGGGLNLGWDDLWWGLLGVGSYNFECGLLISAYNSEEVYIFW